MLNTMRSVGFIKVMMWFVAIAFIGLIVLEWGADFSGRSAGRVGDTVGIIDGKKISYQYFDSLLRNAYRRAKDAGEADPETGKLVRETWDGLLSDILISEQVELLEINASDREVDFVNRAQPAAWVRGYQRFQTDGKFDLAKYTNFLDDPSTYTSAQGKQFVLTAEAEARQTLLRQKLWGLVASSVRVTGPEVRQAYVDDHEKVTVAYAGLEAAAIPDSLVAVSDADVQAYHDAHGEEFHQNTAVRTSFVGFTKSPSHQDSAEVETEVRKILAEVRGGEDFGQLARTYSDDPGSAQRGGDIGFFGRGQMVKPFEEQAFALEPGQVSEPFRSRFGWHIVRVDSVKGDGDGLQVRARHILVRVEAGRNTIDSLRMEAEEFLDLAQDIGFDAAAAGKGYTPSNTGFIPAGGFFPLLGNRTSGLVRAFLESSEGAVSPVYETEQGIYIFALREKRPAGPLPLEEVRSRILAELRIQKKVDRAAEQAAGALGDVRAGKALDAAAAARGLRHEEPNPFSRTGFVPEVGGRNAFIGAAFRLKPGETSDVVTTDRGAYIVKVLDRTPIDESEFDSGKESLAQRLLVQKRNQILTAWYEDLKSKAEIVDNRHHFYTNY